MEELNLYIRYSIIIAIITSIYFISEIKKNAKNLNLGVLAFLVQVFHDVIRSLCVILVIATIRKKDVKLLILLNILTFLILIPFFYYKRCIVTIWYNNILELNPCNRYLSLTERILNIATLPFKKDECKADLCKLAFIWLNSSIPEMIFLLIVNILVLRKIYT